MKIHVARVSLYTDQHVVPVDVEIAETIRQFITERLVIGDIIDWRKAAEKLRLENVGCRGTATVVCISKEQFALIVYDDDGEFRDLIYSKEAEIPEELIDFLHEAFRKVLEAE